MTTGRINQVSTTPPSWHTCTNCHNTMYGQCAALSWCVLHSHKQHVALTSISGRAHLLTYIASARLLSSKWKPAHSKYTHPQAELFNQCCNAQSMWNITNSLPYHRKPKHQLVLVDKHVCKIVATLQLARSVHIRSLFKRKILYLYVLKRLPRKCNFWKIFATICNNKQIRKPFFVTIAQNFSSNKPTVQELEQSDR